MREERKEKNRKKETTETRLWNLVRSLTPSEKRLFRLQSRLHGGDRKAYVRLFDAIDRSGEPDAAAFRSAVNDVADGSYHVLKHYLHRQILRVLRCHAASNAPTTHVENHLQDVRILQERGLIGDALQSLARAREIAERWEMHEYLLLIVSWQRSLGSGRSGAAARLASYDDRIRLLDELREYYDLERVVGLLDIELARGPAATDSEDRQRFDALLPDDAAGPPPPDDAFVRHSTWHWIHATHAYATSDLTRSLDHVEALLAMYRQERRRIEDRPVDYLDVLGNYLLLLHHLGQTDRLLEELAGAEELLDRLAEPKAHPDRRVYQRGAVTIRLRELLMRLERKEYDEMAAVSDRIERSGLAICDPALRSHWSLLLHLCSVGRMMQGDDRGALAWNIRSIEAAPACQSVLLFSVRTLEALLHIRLGNRRLVTSLLGRLPSYRPEDDTLGEAADSLIELLRAMALLDASKRSRNRLERARAELAEVLTGERGGVVFGHVPWLEISASPHPPPGRRTTSTG